MINIKPIEISGRTVDIEVYECDYCHTFIPRTAIPADWLSIQSLDFMHPGISFVLHFCQPAHAFAWGTVWINQNAATPSDATPSE